MCWTICDQCQQEDNFLDISWNWSDCGSLSHQWRPFFIQSLWYLSERSQRKQAFSDSQKSVSVSCSSEPCKLIIHHCALTLRCKQHQWCVTAIYTVINGTPQWTTFNTWPDWLTARCQYGWVEIWIQVGSEYGCDHDSDYAENPVRWSRDSKVRSLMDTAGGVLIWL